MSGGYGGAGDAFLRDYAVVVEGAAHVALVVSLLKYGSGNKRGTGRKIKDKE